MNRNCTRDRPIPLARFVDHAAPLMDSGRQGQMLEFRLQQLSLAPCQGPQLNTFGHPVAPFEGRDSIIWVSTVNGAAQAYSTSFGTGHPK